MAGCGCQGPERVRLSGTVNFRGQPVEKGRIYIFRVKGTMAPSSGAHIARGRYVVQYRRGVPGGRTASRSLRFGPTRVSPTSPKRLPTSRTSCLKSNTSRISTTKAASYN